MILARPENGVIKIGCCAHLPMLEAKRLLQHNLFNGGSPGRMYTVKGWTVACQRLDMPKGLQTRGEIHLSD